MIPTPPPIIIAAETPQPELHGVVGWPGGGETYRYETGITVLNKEWVVTLDIVVFNGFTFGVKVLKPNRVTNYMPQKVPP